MIAMQPVEVQPQFRVALAEVLRAVSTQRLAPRATGRGRTVGYGVLEVTDKVREAIRTGNPLPTESHPMAADFQTLVDSETITQEAADAAVS